MCVDVEMCEVDVQGNAEDDVEYVAHLHNLVRHTCLCTLHMSVCKGRCGVALRVRERQPPL